MLLVALKKVFKYLLFIEPDESKMIRKVQLTSDHNPMILNFSFTLTTNNLIRRRLERDLFRADLDQKLRTIPKIETREKFETTIKMVEVETMLQHALRGEKHQIRTHSRLNKRPP